MEFGFYLFVTDKFCYSCSFRNRKINFFYNSKFVNFDSRSRFDDLYFSNIITSSNELSTKEKQKVMHMIKICVTST